MRCTNCGGEHLTADMPAGAFYAQINGRWERIALEEAEQEKAYITCEDCGTEWEEWPNVLNA